MSNLDTALDNGYAIFVAGVFIVGLIITLTCLPAAWRWCVYGIDNTEPVGQLDDAGNDVRTALASVREVSHG